MSRFFSRLRFRRLWICALFALTVMVFTTREAHAFQPGDSFLEAHLGFDAWGIGGAAGVRFGIPILKEGFLDSDVADTLYFTIGLDAYYSQWAGDYGFAFGIPLTVNWMFSLARRFSLFLELGFNIWFHQGFLDTGVSGFNSSWLMGALGFNIHISRSMTLTIRLGAPYSSLGLTFTL